ncbi:MAG: aldose epimerase family protein [Segetibacter sp.]
MAKPITLRLPEKENFITNVNGKETALYYLENKNNLQAALTNYGARVVSLLFTDKNGKPTDINVGFDNIFDYINAKDQCYGAIVGRYAGRIAGGKFSIDGEAYQLAVNNGNNAIHGGNTGFQTRVWNAEQINNQSVQFNYVSEDGEEGYPGTFTIKAIYTLTDNDELKIELEYSSDKKTFANIINHNFYNLNGEGSGDVNNHLLQINTDKFNAINEDCIPTHIASVKNTPFEFIDFHTIGERINADNLQIKNGTGYDHTYAFDKGVSDLPELVATAIGDISGIAMEVYSTEPGVHFYTGNFMQGLHTFKSGVKDDSRTAFCLETQHYPNSPNNPKTPSTIKEAGKKYTSVTIHKFFIYQ